MKKYIKKIKNYIFKNSLLDNNDALKKQEQKTITLKKEKTSDVSRWSKNNELRSNWNERTAIMASYLVKDSSIIEFGAGVMYLKTILLPTQSYTSSDIVKRFPETLVCDLNEPITFDLTTYNVAIFSGVLEYVYDVDRVLKQLSAAKVSQLILSYCCSDIVLLNREMNGWLSDFKKAEIEEIIKNNNYEILDYTEWNKQSIYNLKLK